MLTALSRTLACCSTGIRTSESAPWLYLGAAALAGYVLVPSKVKWVTVDIEKLAELAKHRQVVVTQKTAPAKGAIGPSLGKMVMGLLWKSAWAVAAQQLNQYFSPRPPSGPPHEPYRPSRGR